jgi:hypothetical protein
MAVSIQCRTTKISENDMKLDSMETENYVNPKPNSMETENYVNPKPIDQ